MVYTSIHVNIITYDVILFFSNCNECWEVVVAGFSFFLIISLCLELGEGKTVFEHGCFDKNNFEAEVVDLVYLI